MCIYIVQASSLSKCRCPGSTIPYGSLVFFGDENLELHTKIPSIIGLAGDSKEYLDHIRAYGLVGISQGNGFVLAPDLAGNIIEISLTDGLDFLGEGVTQELCLGYVSSEHAQRASNFEVSITDSLNRIIQLQDQDPGNFDAEECLLAINEAAANQGFEYINLGELESGLPLPKSYNFIALKLNSQWILRSMDSFTENGEIDRNKILAWFFLHYSEAELPALPSQIPALNENIAVRVALCNRTQFYEIDFYDLDLDISKQALVVTAHDGDSTFQQGGFRSTSSSNTVKTLKMVTVEGAARSAEFQVNFPKGILTDYPRWSSNNFPQGLQGFHEGTWSSSSLGRTTATVEVIPNIFQSIDIELVESDRDEIFFNFDGGGNFAGIVDKINSGLQRIDNSKKIEISGSISASEEFVDFYNDGEKLGRKFTGRGNVTFSLPDISATVPVPIVPSVFLDLSFGLRGTSADFSLEGIYDESRQHKGQIKAGVELNSEVFAAAAPNIDVKILEAKLTVEMSSNFHAGIFAYADGDGIYYDGNVGISESIVTINGEVDVAGVLEFKPFSEVQYPIEKLQWNQSIEKTYALKFND